jgi:hypothetical protein
VETTRDEFHDILDLNTTGIFNMIRAVAPAMMREGRGRIVNVGGTFGMRGRAGRLAYSASKWGLRGVTKSFALELGPHGINVNTVAPGMVDGPRFREKVCANMAAAEGISMDEAAARHAADYALGRVSTARDVANACVFLASDAARQITGVDLPVDGGWARFDVSHLKGPPHDRAQDHRGRLHLRRRAGGGESAADLRRLQKVMPFRARSCMSAGPVKASGSRSAIRISGWGTKTTRAFHPPGRSSSTPAGSARRRSCWPMAGYPLPPGWGSWRGTISSPDQQHRQADGAGQQRAVERARMTSGSSSPERFVGLLRGFWRYRPSGYSWWATRGQ